MVKGYDDTTNDIYLVNNNTMYAEQARKFLLLTQEDVSEDLWVDRVRISRIERWVFPMTKWEHLYYSAMKSKCIKHMLSWLSIWDRIKLLLNIK